MTDSPRPDSTPDDDLAKRRLVVSLANDIASAGADVINAARRLQSLGVPAVDWLELVAMQLADKPAKLLRMFSGYAGGLVEIVLSMKGANPFDMEKLHEAGREALDNVNAARSNEFSVPQQLMDAPAIGPARRFALAVLGTDPDKMFGKYAGPIENLAGAFLALDNDMIASAESPASIRMQDVVEHLFDENSPQVESPDGDPPERAMEAHVLLRGAPMPFAGVLSKTGHGTLKLMTPVPPKPGEDPMFLEHFFDYADVMSITIDRRVKTSAAGPKLWTPGQSS